MNAMAELKQREIDRLQAELREARAQIADLQRKLDETDEDRRPEQALAEARAQIAEQDLALQTAKVERDTWRSNYHEVAAQIAAKDAALAEMQMAWIRTGELRDRAEAQIAAKDAWRRITNTDMPGEELCILGRWTSKGEWEAIVGYLTDMPVATHWLPRDCLPPAPARETE
jgi:chromosome segregation ATPase